VTSRDASTSTASVVISCVFASDLEVTPFVSTPLQYAMDGDHGDRLAAEISLLESMYPEQVQFDAKARELTYRSEAGSLHLRLPDEYLVSALPEILTASKGRNDLRESLKKHIAGLESGEEVLDSIILAFDELSAEMANDTLAINPGRDLGQDDEAKATIIVWLHHLLNANKRKEALSPTSGVSGLTKPGYPGVLIYSGPAEAVNEHVNELKQLNWQVFQVRLESEEEWTFTHGKGVREVEAMKDLVAGIGEDRKEVFMEAMRMK
jgi:hypothetical protein